MTNQRITKYEKLLREKYGSRVFDALFRVNYENNTLSFIKDKIALNKFIIEYKRKNEGCKNKNCKSVFNDLFYERPMEIPGSIKPLDFTIGTRARLFMVVGEAAGPDISTNLNLIYGFINLNLNDDGTWNEAKNDNIFSQLKETVNDKALSDLKFSKFKNWNQKSKAEKLRKFRTSIECHILWKYFAEIFGESFGYLKQNLYITDLCKCNAKGNIKWKDCFEECINFLYEEVHLIKPLLIIFLGKKSREQFINLLITKGEKVSSGKLNGKEVNLENYYEDFKKLRFFKSFRIGNLPVFMINIYHNSWLTNYLTEDKKNKVDEYIKQCKKFVQEIVLPLIKK